MFHQNRSQKKNHFSCQKEKGRKKEEEKETRKEKERKNEEEEFWNYEITR